MKINKTKLKDLYLIKLNKFKDNRGSFTRLFCQNEIKKILKNDRIVQVNHSITKKIGSIRGLHYQNQPFAEIKFVYCIKGKVFDVCLDVRYKSNTFLKLHSEILSEEDNKILFIPKGFAHGFQCLSRNSELIYFHTQFYSKKHELGVNVFDPKIKINWPKKISEISNKDKDLKFLDDSFNGIKI